MNTNGKWQPPTYFKKGSGAELLLNPLGISPQDHPEHQFLGIQKLKIKYFFNSFYQ